VKYSRILLKISGEALAGDNQFGIQINILNRVVKIIQSIRKMKIEMAIVVGGGNIFRGAELSENGMNKITGDHIGMLATTMNALAISDSLNRNNIESEVMSGFSIGGGVCESFNHNKAKKKLKENKVLIFSAGTGSPCFTTDTAAVLRGIEINADIVFKATKVDGVYSDDPMKNPNALKFKTLTYKDALEKKLQIMDTAAFALAETHKIPICVFNLFNDIETLSEILKGKKHGTIITQI